MKWRETFDLSRAHKSFTHNYSLKRIKNVFFFPEPNSIQFTVLSCAMAQDDDINNHNALQVTSSDSMNPCKDMSGGEDSKGSSRLVVVGAIDKGKGVAKTEGEDQVGGSNGKISPPHVAAAARDGRSGGHRGNRELHITTERERRKRMSKMFNELRSLLPTLPDKVMRLCYTRILGLRASDADPH
jgi:hypothetical protein